MQQLQEIREKVITASNAEIKAIRAAARRKLNAIKELESDLGVSSPAPENKGVTAAVRGALTRMSGAFTARDVAARIKAEGGQEFPIATVRSTLKWLELKNSVVVVERGIPRTKETKYGVPAQAPVECPF